MHNSQRRGVKNLTGNVERVLGVLSLGLNNMREICAALVLVLGGGCSSAVAPGAGPSTSNSNTVKSSRTVVIDAPRPAASSASQPKVLRGNRQLASWVEPLRKVLMKRDFAQLAKWAHPLKGIRFSPYAYVDTSDTKLTVTELQAAMADPKQRHWGVYDGSGEAIQLSFAEYFERFIMIPKLETAQHAVDQSLSTGNTLNNLREIYPQARFIELHSPGVDPEYAGMDWQSVRIVFETHQGQPYIVGIVHDQWTI